MTQTYLLAGPAKEVHLCRCQEAYHLRVKAATGISPHPDADQKRAAAESTLRARLAAHPDLIAGAIVELEEAIVSYTTWAAEAWGRSQKSALGSSPQGRRNAKIEAAGHRQDRDLYTATLAVLREFAP